jgi:hypothetical protein
LAQQKSDVADTYDLYVKMAKLQREMASSQCSVETARQTTFAMELKTAEGKAAIAAEQKERELVHMGKLGAFEAEQKRILSEMEAEQKRKQNEEELCFLQRKQELMVAPPEAKPKKMVQTKLDFFGKKKEDMKTYSELFVEVAKGTAPPETFGPTAKQATISAHREMVGLWRGQAKGHLQKVDRPRCRRRQSTSTYPRVPCLLEQDPSGRPGRWSEAGLEGRFSAKSPMARGRSTASGCQLCQTLPPRGPVSAPAYDKTYRR